MTLTEAVEYVESLGVDKISLNGIGLNVIRQLADLLRTKFLAYQQDGIVIFTSEEQPDFKFLHNFGQKTGTMALWMTPDCVAEVFPAEEAIQHILKEIKASPEDRRRIAAKILE